MITFVILSFNVLIVTSLTARHLIQFEVRDSLWDVQQRETGPRTSELTYTPSSDMSQQSCIEPSKHFPQNNRAQVPRSCKQFNKRFIKFIEKKNKTHKSTHEVTEWPVKKCVVSPSKGNALKKIPVLLCRNFKGIKRMNKLRNDVGKNLFDCLDSKP